MRAIVGAALVAGVAGASGHEAKFSEFLRMHNRSYASPEERISKLAVFVGNLEHIAAHQEADLGDAQYSHLSPFADISPEEFSRRHGLRSPEGLELAAPREEAPQFDVDDLPESFDWREKGAVNKVKDQKECGSCWAFAAVANIEGAAFVAAGNLVSLSEQELVDCDKGEGDQGCDGGLPSQAYQYLIDRETGLEKEEEYPYEARDGRCRERRSKNVVFITGWSAISEDEDQIAAALMKNGPLAIGINAAFMQFYSGGIATYRECGRRLDHGVAIVGFGNEGRIEKKHYWIIRNSWGPMWGEEGYYRIVRGFGMCGLNTAVTTAMGVTLKQRDDFLVV